MRTIQAIFAIFFLSLFCQAAEPEAVPGEYVVKMKRNVSLFNLNKKQLGQNLGSAVVSVLPDHNMVVVKRAVFEIQSSGVNVLSQNDLVEYAEPNFIYHPVLKPNDPSYEKLWGLKNLGIPRLFGSPAAVENDLVDISAEQAWEMQTGSKDVIVAVVDTGVDYQHPDLKDNIWVNEKEKNGQAGIDDDDNGVIDDIYGASFINDQASNDITDEYEHGTHCAGTIGATGNNGVGVVGVNWNVRILPVKFMGKNGGNLADALRAIDYATKMGAKILSNSWSGSQFSQALKDVIETSGKSGTLFIAAAGNDHSDNDQYAVYPASYELPNVISVAAIDNKGHLASFSNFGKKSVHLAAPGSEIYSTMPGGHYEYLSGTSMATPHVSGVAALLLAQEPQITALEIKQRILSTLRTVPELRRKMQFGGILNADNALRNHIPPPNPEDPFFWQTKEASISTEHPYKDNARQEFLVQVEGAKQIALYFSKFVTEAGADNLKIYNAQNELLQTLSDDQEDTFSIVIDGDSARLVFETDGTFTRYGFDITKVAWR